MRNACRWFGWIALGAMSIALASARDMSGQERATAAGSGLVGSPAPRLSVTTIDGQAIDLGSLYGRKAVYLKFWATWCVPCREQMPHFQRTFEGAGSDLAVIAVNAGFNDSLDEIRTYRQRLGISMPIVMDDGRLAEAFNLRVTPQHIVIGRDGRVLYVGHLADAALDAAVSAARSTPGGTPGGAPDDAKTVAGSTGATHAIRVGERLPVASLQTLDGRAFRVRAEETGQPTAYLFLSPWCESYLATTRPVVSANCRSAREQVDRLARDPHVRWLGIASGLWASPDDLRDYQAKNNIGIALALDESGALFRQFGVHDTPTIVVADAHGKVIRRVEASQVGELTQVISGL